MDLNELYSRHQISVARAADRSSPTVRDTFRRRARDYAERIADLQSLAGVVHPTVVIGA
ncbi:hypothetical protein [Sphingomonas sp. BK580]|uniref:hypothetical protein n=1 Tax=Sphingomonas sp. BK580 TaxID=2586972 RepID=UPI001620298F|nr:hypothetical protein [Sphingomonas sp. BK580]MBB3694377.1 hypothetical protein [Sphingomonas sp. BK580]